MEVSQKSKSRLNGGYNLLILKRFFSNTSQNQQSLLVCVSMHQILAYIEYRYNIHNCTYYIIWLEYVFQKYTRRLVNKVWSDFYHGHGILCKILLWGGLYIKAAYMRLLNFVGNRNPYKGPIRYFIYWLLIIVANAIDPIM